ncbi:hypothetical protein [uncultured Methanobrevibacter sp.]|uniref:hypothetical protein n=1 Tax=uncultured Methanobrevibacter sp. TaxID=253161 RepID=UPI0025DE7B5F|nr:hypothetical protein [uncultured Methanobrevibacter sp.]
MDKKWFILIIILLVALSVMIYLNNNSSQVIDKSGEKLSFNVSSGSSVLSRFVNDTKTKPDYVGYDRDTVKWMESLGDKRVFFGNESVIIMDIGNAEKIPDDHDITDVFVFDHFKADVVENHRLCDKIPEVYYVENVTFLNQEIVDAGLA